MYYLVYFNISNIYWSVKIWIKYYPISFYAIFETCCLKFKKKVYQMKINYSFFENSMQIEILYMNYIEVQYIRIQIII